MHDPDCGENVAFVALGGNVGTQQQVMTRFRAALDLLRDRDGICLTHKSSVYRTPAWGVTDQPDFLNAVVQLRCRLTPQKLLRELKSIEQQLGRVDRKRWGPRELDLDLLLFGDSTVADPDLTVPHPGLLERHFVLVPLLEIDPDVKLPDGRAVSQAAQVALGESEKQASKIEKCEDRDW